MWATFQGTTADIDDPLNVSFRGETIDGSPPLLEKSYRLRYETFCLQRRFLNADDYPSQLERDEFDDHSVHVGVLDADDDLAGTARIVKPNPAGLPALVHCSLFPGETALAAGSVLVEISRVCINRRYARRRTDQFLAASKLLRNTHAMPARQRRRHRGDVFTTLVRTLYHATKRLGATHWLVAIEKSLRRRIAQHGLPFKVAGSETDYYGLVAPYIMSLAEFDQVILGRHFASLDDFLVGLEPELQPRLDDHRPPVGHSAG